MSSNLLAIADLTPEIRNEWADIVAARELNPSLHPSWFDVITQTVARREDVRVLTITGEQGKLCGIIPHFAARRSMLGIPVDTLQLTSNLISYHAEIVANDVPSVIRRLVGLSEDTHVFQFSELPVGGVTHQALKDVCTELGLGYTEYPGAESPFLQMSGSFDDYLATKRKKIRYKYRQRAKALTQNSRLTMSTHSSPEDIDGLLADIVAIEARSWKREAGLDIADGGIEIDYYRTLLPMLAQREALLAFVLRAGNQAISYSLCCVWGDWVGNLKTSFDTSFAKDSPGALVLDSALRAAFDRGAKEFDFLGNADPYKLSWASGVRKHVDCFVYSKHLRARLIAAARKLKRRWLERGESRNGKPQ